MHRRGSRNAAAVLGFAALCSTASTQAWAQAWLNPKGHGRVSLIYVYTDVRKHFFSQAKDNVPIGNGKLGRSDVRDLGHISADTGVLTADYSLTDRIGVGGQVAFVGSKYQGSRAEAPTDGSWVKSFQDLTLDLRYRAVRWPVALTPFVAFSTPTHNYATLGHSAVGVGLRSYDLGASLGRGLAPLLPGGYFQGTYTYGFVQNLGEHGLNNHNLNLELGYFATQTLSFRVLSVWHYTPDGFDWSDKGLFVEHGMDHDRAAAARYNRIGGGLGYSLRGYDLYLVYEETIRGANTHAAKSTIFGTSWNF